MKFSSRIITIDRTPIFLGNDVFTALDRLITTLAPHGIFILVDENTRKYCLPLLLQNSSSLAASQVIETVGGESSKSLEKAEEIWRQLMKSGAGRSSLLVNLGGGIISDLGGFVASGYKRGIRYINIPTSLVGQADAAIGGKTAINFGHIKNQVGFFYAAAGIFIFPGFLKTLPAEHLRSGLAEIIKSTLISDAGLWRKLLNHPVGEILDQNSENRLWLSLIAGAVKFKNKIVMHDYREQKLRKVLNFGHTIGHALEGLSHTGSGKPLLHGHAVAAGMICASYLSYRKTGLSRSDNEMITKYLAGGFPPVPVEVFSKQELMEHIMQDKKVRGSQVHFTLIKKPGQPVINVSCDQGEIFDSLDYYRSMVPII